MCPLYIVYNTIGRVCVWMNLPFSLGFGWQVGKTDMKCILHEDSNLENWKLHEKLVQLIAVEGGFTILFRYVSWFWSWSWSCFCCHLKFKKWYIQASPRSSVNRFKNTIWTRGTFLFWPCPFCVSDNVDKLPFCSTNIFKIKRRKTENQWISLNRPISLSRSPFLSIHLPEIQNTMSIWNIDYSWLDMFYENCAHCYICQPM